MNVTELMDDLESVHAQTPVVLRVGDKLVEVTGVEEDVVHVGDSTIAAVLVLEAAREQ